MTDDPVRLVDDDGSSRALLAIVRAPAHAVPALPASLREATLGAVDARARNARPAAAVAIAVAAAALLGVGAWHAGRGDPSTAETIVPVSERMPPQPGPMLVPDASVASPPLDRQVPASSDVRLAAPPHQTIDDLLDRAMRQAPPEPRGSRPDDLGIPSVFRRPRRPQVSYVWVLVPAGAHIVVDGVDSGVVAPGRATVTPGPHRISVVVDGRTVHELPIDLPVGRTTRVGPVPPGGESDSRYDEGRAFPNFLEDD